jgi:pimeloyl-ACP methyl ester carboxylesterase
VRPLAPPPEFGENSTMNSAAPSSSPTELPLNSNFLAPQTLPTAAPTLVLLHGWGRSLNALRPMGELLASSCKVLLIDLPGFGLSPLPHGASNDGGGWGTYEYSERVKRFLDESGVRSCILIGHSFGGRISVQLAARYPDLARGLILIGSHGLKRKRAPIDALRIKGIQLLGSSAKKIDGAIGTRLFAHYFAPRFGSADYKAAGDLRKTLVKTVNEDLAAQASQIKAPTLLLWGENDVQTPLDLAQSFKLLIADSELHTFPHKDHEPFSDVGAHLMAKYIETFLQTRGLLQ